MGRTTFLSTVYPKLSAGRQSEGHVRHLNRDEISRRPLRGGLSAVGTRMPAASRGAVLRLRQLPYRRLPTFPFTDSRTEGPGASLGRQGPLWGKALGNLFCRAVEKQPKWRLIAPPNHQPRQSCRTHPGDFHWGKRALGQNTMGQMRAAAHCCLRRFSGIP